MFTVEERGRVRDRLLEIGRSDHRIVSAALVGASSGDGDRWSDLDITFGVADEASNADVLSDWTEVVQHEFQASKLFDVMVDSSIYRVFLFSGNLQVDLSFTPAAHFGARGPKFQLLWGRAIQRQQSPSASPEYLFGLAVHHLVRTRICIERGKFWQAEYWINEARNYALTLACLHHGLETRNGRGLELLPKDILDRFKEARTDSLTRDCLMRVIKITIEGLLRNSQDVPRQLVKKLESQLRELTLAF